MGWKHAASRDVGHTTKERQDSMRKKTRGKATKPGSLSDRVAQGGAIRMTSAEARITASVTAKQATDAPWY